MNDLAAWGVIAGMAGYGFAVLGLARLAERRRARRAEPAPTPRPDPAHVQARRGPGAGTTPEHAAG